MQGIKPSAFMKTVFLCLDFTIYDTNKMIVDISLSLKASAEKRENAFVYPNISSFKFV